MQYRNTSKFDTPKDAPGYITDLMNQLRNELKNIEIALSKATGSTVVIAGSGASGSITPTGSSSGGATVASDKVKAGVDSVTAGTTKFVPFPPGAFDSAPIITLCFIAATNGGFGAINTSLLTVTSAGFSIPADEVLMSGTVFYIAVLNS